MADTPPTDLLQQLQTFMAQHAAGQAPAAGWGQPVAAPMQFRAVNVPLRVPLPDGSEIRLYAELPGEVLASQQALLSALQALKQQGLPLDTWQPRGDGAGWGNRGSGLGNWGGRRRW